MNKAVQILLLCSFLFPMVGTAREETLEERKKRIVRKYLREHRPISQSDIMVPSDQLPEDEKVAESEKYEQTADMFERQEAGSMPAPPPQQYRRPIPQPLQNNSSWLLNEESAEMEDPYADPFALDKPKDAGTRNDYWNRRTDETTGSESRDGSGRYDPYASRERASGMDPRSRQDIYSGAERNQKDSRYGYDGISSSDGESGNRYDRQQYGTIYGSSGVGLQPRRRTYGSSPESGMLDSSFPQLNPSEADRRSQPGYDADRSGYTPSYQTPRQPAYDRS
ncbi:MAG: hypothetical protein OES84_01560, partial [Kiritimatiellaceae bacterium]|nr:hypothetical protein [Kiritimatiellaceae bacterium]